MLRRNGPVVKSVESVLRLEGSLWGERFVEEVGLVLITFRVCRRRREMYCGYARLCLSVCLSAAACPHYCTDPDVTWGSGRGCPLVLQDWGFAIGARVVLLRQHNANAKC